MTSGFRARPYSMVSGANPAPSMPVGVRTRTCAVGSVDGGMRGLLVRRGVLGDVRGGFLVEDADVFRGEADGEPAVGDGAGGGDRDRRRADADGVAVVVAEVGAALDRDGQRVRWRAGGGAASVDVDVLGPDADAYGAQPLVGVRDAQWPVEAVDAQEGDGLRGQRV